MYFSGVSLNHHIFLNATFSRYYFLNSGFRIAYKKLTGKAIKLKKYAGKALIDVYAANDLIKQKILEGKPFMAGRYGASELNCVTSVMAYEKNIQKQVNQHYINSFCTAAGFFPNTKEHAIKFTNMLLELSKEADLIGIWRILMEDYIIKYYAPNSTLTLPRALEPFHFENPWSKALEGKKVLVIHPFEKSIISQYEKRKLLFKNKDVLPDFELKTIKAVQTIAGTKSEFETWFDALDFMYNKALETDFDVAIIGAGAYGFPLAAMLKKAGKQAIHMGGITQILFGIKGKRWDEHPAVASLFNEHWVKPDPSEIPQKASLVEGGCYW